MNFRRRWIPVLLVMICCAALRADEPKSTEVRRAQATYEAALKKAQAEIAAARSTYLAQLDAAMKQAMIAGDLEEANRIDALRKSVHITDANIATATGTPEAPSVPGKKPGYVVGTITDSAGKPITGWTYEVACFGTTLKGGERTSLRLEVDADGHFEQELPDGLYAVTAYILKDVGGSHFRIQLHPKDEKPDLTKLSSKPGIAKDFVWKLTGVRPGLDASQPGSHYGGAVRVYDSQYLGEADQKLAGKFSAGSQAQITLTPRGTRLDGSIGTPIQLKAPLTKIGDTLGHVAMDIPFGAYKVSARIITADGKIAPAKCATAFRGPFNETADFEFVQPGVYDAVKPVGIYLNP